MVTANISKVNSDSQLTCVPYDLTLENRVRQNSYDISKKYQR